MPAILFVCRHNACRSQIAEAIGRELAPKAWLIESAGSHPTTQVDPKAIIILRKYGLLMRRKRPQALALLPLEEWDFVVDVSCVRSGIGVKTRNYINWDLADPEDGPLPVYDELFAVLSERIHDLFRGIQQGLDAEPLPRRES